MCRCNTSVTVTTSFGLLYHQQIWCGISLRGCCLQPVLTLTYANLSSAFLFCFVFQSHQPALIQLTALAMPAQLLLGHRMKQLSDVTQLKATPTSPLLPKWEADSIWSSCLKYLKNLSATKICTHVLLGQAGDRKCLSQICIQDSMLSTIRMHSAPSAVTQSSPRSHTARTELLTEHWSAHLLPAKRTDPKKATII